MNEQENSNAENQVSCETCHKEIPKSLAKVAEAEEYVRYYCGLDCFEKGEDGAA